MKAATRRLLSILLALTLALGTVPAAWAAEEIQDPDTPLAEDELSAEEEQSVGEDPAATIPEEAAIEEDMAPAEEEVPAEEELPVETPEQESPAEPAEEEEPVEEEPAPLAAQEVEEESVTGEAMDAVTVSYAGNGKVSGGTQSCRLMTENAKNISGWYAVTESMTLDNQLDVFFTANLILCDGVTLTAPKGIYIENDASLTIWCQSGGTGKLVASNEPLDGSVSMYAAIGGANQDIGGPLTIQGGVIEANSYTYGAAIGGGYHSGVSGSITINGGSVKAINYDEGTAIGGGNMGKLTSLTVNGGTVYAEAKGCCPGIGGGNGGDSVTINGGSVTAIGGYKSAGIGAAGEEKGITQITMNSGMLTAVAGYWDNLAEEQYVQAIGSGYPDYNKDQGTLTLASGCSVKMGYTADSTEQVTGDVYVSRRSDLDYYGGEDAAKLHYVQIRYYDAPAADPNPNPGEFTDWTSTTTLPSEDGNYKLTADVNLADRWTAPDMSVINLDLNGHTIFYGDDYYSAINVKSSSATLNLFDSSENGTGKLTGAQAGFVNVNGGTFQMYGGSITGNFGRYCGGISINNGTVRLYGGSITGNTCEYTPNGWTSYGCAGVRFKGGTLEISGDVNITGNTCYDADTQTVGDSNVLVDINKTITLMGPLSSSARIGLTSHALPTTSRPAVPLTSGMKGNATANNFILDQNVNSSDETNGSFQLTAMNGEMNLTITMFTLTLAPGQGSGEMDALHSTGGNVTLPKCTFTTPEGQIFDCWQIGEDQYTRDSQFNLQADVTATAIYKDGSAWDVLVEDIAAGDDVTLMRDLTIDGNSSAITVPAGKTVTLDLNGFTLSMQTNNGAMATGPIEVSGTLNVKDSSDNKTGTIIGGINTASGGGGCLVKQGGRLIWYSGTLKDGCARRGGGVYVESGGIFRMQSGAIQNCTAAKFDEKGGDGGGIYVAAGGQADLSGSVSVQDCSAANQGGGIYAAQGSEQSYSKVSITGASIKNNQSGYAGGGLFLDSFCRFNVYGGCTVQGNYAQNSTAGGVYMTSGVTGMLVNLTVTGNKSDNGVGGVQCGSSSVQWTAVPVVTGNVGAKRVFDFSSSNTVVVRDEAGEIVYEESNLYAYEPLNISGVAPSAALGICFGAIGSPQTPAVVTTSFASADAASTALSCMKVDNDLDGLALGINENHQIYAGLDLSTATLTIPAKTYTGKAQTAAVTVKLGDTTLTKDTDYTVSGATRTNAGTYTVTVTGAGAYTGTATGTFQIKKASQTLTVKPTSATVLVGKTQTITTTGGKTTVKYASSNTKVATVTSAGVVKGVAPGTAKITVSAAANGNYNAAANKTVTITVKCAAPAISKLENVKGGIKLTYSKSAGAGAYRIFCKTGSGGWKAVGYSTGTTFTAKTSDGKTALKAGTKYTFTVRCVAKSGSATYTSDYNTTGKAWVYAPVTTISKVTNSKAKTATVTWKKTTGVTGYEIQYSLSKTFASGNKSVKVKGAATVSKAIGSLTKGKTYYFRIRTYVTTGGKTYSSPWSAAVSGKISK